MKRFGLTGAALLNSRFWPRLEWEADVSRPFGTGATQDWPVPALKRWAILGCPSGTRTAGRGKRISERHCNQPGFCWSTVRVSLYSPLRDGRNAGHGGKSCQERCFSVDALDGGADSRVERGAASAGCHVEVMRDVLVSGLCVSQEERVCSCASGGSDPGVPKPDGASGFAGGAD